MLFTVIGAIAVSAVESRTSGGGDMAAGQADSSLALRLWRSGWRTRCRQSATKTLSSLALFLLAALIAWSPVAGAAPEAASADGRIVLGIDTRNNFVDPWMRLVYGEAFRRLHRPLEIVYIPTKRLSVLIDEGSLDGEVLRAYGYAGSHPALLRVEETITKIRVVLWSADEAVRPVTVDDVAKGSWRVMYRRGMGICENPLRAAVQATRLSEAVSTEEGLRVLLARRVDLLCDVDLAVYATLAERPAAERSAVRETLQIGAPVPLYPYLHRRNADLALALAQTLRRMKAEGLIERYREEAERGTAARLPPGSGEGGKR
jgi:hypothetical protein